MKIPKKVKIGAHTYTIDLVPSKIIEDECGSISYPDQEITINKDLSQTMQEATLLHEAIHAMNTTIDHELMDSLAEQIYSFLKENNLLR